MAIISSYPLEVTMQDNDAWIGTEFATKQTKQFTADSLADYINVNNKIDIGVASINSGSGITITGTTAIPIVSVDYSAGADNLVQSASITTTIEGGGSTSPYVLISKSNPSVSNGAVQKIRLGSIPVSKLGTATSFLNMGDNRIANLATPTVSTDAVNKTYVDSALTGYVQSVTGGNGVSVTGTTQQPIVNVDYSSSGDNLIQAATESAAPIGTGAFTPYVLMNESYPGGSDAFTKKIRIGNIPVSTLGEATGTLSMGDERITNLATPIDSTDAVNKTYVDSELTGYVQSVTGGNGIAITGSSAAPTLAVDYSVGADNLIQSATATTTFNLTEPYADYILKSGANPGYANGPVEKIRSSDIPLNAFGEATGTLSMGNQRIKNLGTPIDSTDTASKAYVDAAVVGSLFYQGGYNASTNTPDLDRDAVVKTVGIASMGSGGGPLGSTVVNTVATTGTGQGLTLNIQLNSAGNVISATVANGGTGYAVGDTIGLTGLSGHSGSVISIATIATAGSPAASIGIKKGWTYTVWQTVIFMVNK